MAQLTDAELLAALLDGEVAPGAAPAELRLLADLAEQVSTHTVVPLPSPAFKEALRADLMQHVASVGAAGTGAAAATTAATAGGGLASSAVAAIAAAAVLGASGLTAAATNAGPTDALYDAKRSIEEVQLLVAGDGREVDLLLDFATARIEEALAVVDTALVWELVAESERLVDEAFSQLLAVNGADLQPMLDEFRVTHGGALQRLADSTQDPELVDELRSQLASVTARTGGAVPTTSDDGTTAVDGVDGDAPSDTADDVTGGGDAPGTDGTDASDGGTTDDTGGTVDDTVDDVTDGVDDAVDDITDDLGDTVDDVTDGVDDAVEDVTDTVGGALGDG